MRIILPVLFSAFLQAPTPPPPPAPLSTPLPSLAHHPAVLFPPLAPGPAPPRPSRRSGSGQDAGRAVGRREVQGDDQGADAVRRSPAGNRSQPCRGRLD